ncbi:MAG: DEAD/DEAH box helicase [Planctomycetes bacterium]|nr:DEAD/DEAH box helicase [Planctomycetota bacterium]
MTNEQVLETPEAVTGFASLGVDPKLLSTLTALGYEEPTPIQREAIPPLLAGRDLLGQAATGTGKTAAFALPLLQRLAGGDVRPGRPRALVLVPTRELAMQVAEAVHKYGREQHVSVLPIYGGQSIWQQLRALERGVEIVVATPGRALDHLERGTLDLAEVGTVVLDEADEMLDMGFAEDLESILGRLPDVHQTALFSATMSPRILGIAEQHLKDPLRISIARESTTPGETPRVKQTAYVVPRAHKHQALGRVLDMETPTSAIVFCRTRLEVDELTEAMNARGYRAEALHGGFQQEQRDRVMKRFRSGASDLLIATDVAARGLDIEHVSHVVNYDVPTEAETYVHRIGRTGRAGREGVAITFVEPREHRLLRIIQQVTKQKIEVATIPTVTDLRNRRLELTRAALHEAIVAGELDSFRAVAEALSSEFDPMDVAAAAVKLAHQASHAEAGSREDEQDIPNAPQPQERPRHESRPSWGQRERAPQRGAPPFEHGRAPRFEARERFERRETPETARLFIGAGRFDALRPGDLVGAIANEAGLPGNAIGPIRIADRFSLVEVPADAAEQVIRALRGTTIRGRRVNVRYDRQ